MRKERLIFELKDWGEGVKLKLKTDVVEVVFSILAGITILLWIYVIYYTIEH